MFNLFRSSSQGFQKSIKYLTVFICVLWAIEILNIASGGLLRQYGIYPRELDGIFGIFTTPFLHGGLRHLLSNTIPLVILGVILATHGLKTFIQSTLIVVIIGGLMVWLFGRPSNHIGASGLVFGWWGFLIGLGYFKRDWKALLTALIVLFLYGGMFFGLLIVDARISFESHIFGAIAGIVAAAILANKSSTKNVQV
jgi:membrane associated rhomboid family serine protease